MFNKIRGFFMNILNMFHSYSIEDVTGINTAISNEMLQKIELWQNIAQGVAPWNKKAKSCGIVQQLSGKLSMLVSREISLQVENKTIENVMQHLDKNITKIVEYIAIMGGAIVRPVYTNNKLQYEALSLGSYLPTCYDFDGTLTGAILLKQFEDNGKKYLLTENHNYSNNTHKVECSLYENKNGVLNKVSLTSCNSTKDITPVYEWQNVQFPMIVEFRNHSVNLVDGSNVPVSMLCGIENIIKDADEQYERMNWEQESGEKRIFADRDLFQRRQIRNGESVTTELKPELNRLVTMIDGDGLQNNDKIKEFSPILRTNEQKEMLQQIFRRIELSMNIGKGSLSDMESVTQTATQYTGGRSELFAIVDRLESEIETKYKMLANIFAYMAKAYGLGENNANITITWNDDTTRKDIVTAKTMALNEINAGVRNKWEYRKEFFNEDENTAKQNVPEEKQKDFTPSIFGE